MNGRCFGFAGYTTIVIKEVTYRTKQFLTDINPPELSETEWEEIGRWLSSRERALFEQYSQSDQAHAFSVLCTLRQAGHHQPQLLAAALLHDIGKSRFRISVWDRVWPVLLKKAFPALYQKWGDAKPVGWKRPFVIIKQHPEWGAKMATEVGSHPQTVSLIRRHQDKLGKIETEEDELLAHLQWADNQN